MMTLTRVMLIIQMTYATFSSEFHFEFSFLQKQKINFENLIVVVVMAGMVS